MFGDRTTGNDASAATYTNPTFGPNSLAANNVATSNGDRALAANAVDYLCFQVYFYGALDYTSKVNSQTVVAGDLDTVKDQVNYFQDVGDATDDETFSFAIDFIAENT